MALRIHNGVLAFERDDDVIFLPYTPGVNDDNWTELQQMERSFGITAFHAGQNADLRQLDGQLVIWGHGNFNRGFIASGLGEKITASQIVGLLAGMRLPTTFAGNVILWSCFAGVANGFATTLLRHFRSKSYGTLKVYGPRYATGTMAATPDGHRYMRALTVFTNGATVGGSVEGSSGGPGFSTNGWIGLKTLATPADVPKAAIGHSVDI